MADASPQPIDTVSWTPQKGFIIDGRLRYIVGVLCYPVCLHQLLGGLAFGGDCAAPS